MKCSVLRNEFRWIVALFSPFLSIFLFGGRFITQMWNSNSTSTCRPIGPEINDMNSNQARSWFKILTNSIEIWLFIAIAIAALFVAIVIVVSVVRTFYEFNVHFFLRFFFFIVRFAVYVYSSFSFPLSLSFTFMLQLNSI